MIRFMLSLCLLLAGALAHTRSQHTAYLYKARFCSLHNYVAMVGNAPASGKRTVTDSVSAGEIEEDDDPVPARKEVKKLFPFYSALAYSSLDKSPGSGTIFTQWFNHLSSPAFIINCVFRI